MAKIYRGNKADVQPCRSFSTGKYLIKNGSGSNDPLHAACGFD